SWVKERDQWQRNERNAASGDNKKKLRITVSRVLRAGVANTIFPKDIWADDSSASMHIANSKARMTNFKPQRDVEISLGDGRQIKGLGIGNIRIGKLELKDV